MSFVSDHPSSNSLRLSDQRWYQNSSNNMSMYMKSNVGGTGSNTSTHGTATHYGTIPIVAPTGNEKSPYNRKLSNQTSSDVERLLPDLLVMEIHRDGNNAVTYRHSTIRGLYRYVLDAIADRTGILQAAAYYQLWQKKTIGSSSNSNKAETDKIQPNVDSATQEPAVATGTIDPTTSTQPPPSKPIDIGLTSSSPHNVKQNNSVTYRERLGGYLHPRDMRRLVTPFSTSNEPEIIVRRHVILINYDPLRTIILRDRLLVLVPNGADSLLSKLEVRIRGSNSQEGVENAIFGTNMDKNDSKSATTPTPPSTTKSTTVSGKTKTGRTFNTKSTSITSEKSNVVPDATTVTTDHVGDEDDNINDDMTNMDEWHEMVSREWVNLPFELQCTDAVLSVVASILHEETIEVQEAAQTFIERIVKDGGAGLEDDPSTIIRVVKDAVQLMSKRVKSFVQSIHRLLDDDEDMALMNLSRLLTHPERFVQPVSQRILNEESDEPELILESNLQVGLTLVNYLDVIQNQIHTAKELIDQRLDATRNKLLFANMLISVFTLCVTLGALVGSFFGMNLVLPNNLGEDDFAFNQVVAYTCIGCLVICVFIMITLLYTDTIPFRLSRRFRPVRINV